MNTGRFKTISMEQVLASIKLELNLENTSQWDGYVSILIDEAAKHLWHNDQMAINCVQVDIVEGRAQLPNGFNTLLAIMLVNENGSPYQFEYVNSAQFVNAGIFFRDGLSSKPYEVSPVEGGHIVFNDPCGLPAPACKIWYVGRNVDANGLTLIHELEERAIRAYVCHRFSLKYPKNFDAYQRQFWNQEWLNQKKWLNAKANVDFWRENRDRLAALFNAFLVFKDIGQS